MRENGEIKTEILKLRGAKRERESESEGVSTSFAIRERVLLPRILRPCFISIMDSGLLNSVRTVSAIACTSAASSPAPSSPSSHSISPNKKYFG